MDIDDLLLSPFTARDAAGCGIGRDQLRRLCRDRVLRRMLHGVYASSYLEDDLSLRAAAVALVLPPDAVLCRRSAAWLRGVDLRCPGESPLQVEVLVDVRREPPRRPGLVAHQSTLPDQDVEVIRGLPVTSGVRTAVDLARYRPRTEGVVALDALAHAGHCRLEQVTAVLPSLRGRRGVRRLALAVSLADPRSESPMETRLRLVIVDAGLPTPDIQCEVLDRWGEVMARLDLAYPHCRLGIEYDGRIVHSAALAFSRDRERQNELLLAGWTLLRFVARDVLWRPQYVVRQVDDVLAAHAGLRTA